MDAETHTVATQLAAYLATLAGPPDVPRNAARMPDLDDPAAVGVLHEWLCAHSTAGVLTDAAADGAVYVGWYSAGTRVDGRGPSLAVALARAVMAGGAA